MKLSIYGYTRDSSGFQKHDSTLIPEKEKVLYLGSKVSPTTRTLYHRGEYIKFLTVKLLYNNSILYIKVPKSQIYKNFRLIVKA